MSIVFGVLSRAKSKGGADDADEAVVAAELGEALVIVVDVEIKGLEDASVVLEDLDVLDGAVVIRAGDPKPIVE